jgi:hypothetical protein
MSINYLAKIIAKDNQGLQLISACCADAKVGMEGIKYLPKNKIFLLSLKRFRKETNNIEEKIDSICKFEFVDKVKSKNINQNATELELKLIAIDIFKNKKNYEINLIFSDNAYITLLTEIIEVTLEDQDSKIND